MSYGEKKRSMTSERKRWFKEDGLELIEPDARQNNPSIAYSPREMPKPNDVLYKLSYDSDLRYLMLNGFVIQTFQFESHADRYFKQLFDEPDDIKTISVHSPAKSDVLVNNINMPIKLRNAFFTTGSKGTRLQVHTIMTRRRAQKFNVIPDEIEDYINKSRDAHYKLRDANKRK